MTRFAAAVVGLGHVGQGYDYDEPDGSTLLTHASGFAYHRAYELVGAVDPDPRQRRRFEEKFRRPAFPDVETLLGRQRLDVISVAVPTPAHGEVLREVLHARPRAVLCEKPIADSVGEAQRMVRLANTHRCALAVNYMRRFEPGVLRMRAAIRRGLIGDVYKATVWYDRGLMNGGSHFVDLLLFLFGDVEVVRVLRPGRRWLHDDPEPDLHLRLRGMDAYLLAARGECFGTGELLLVGTRGTVRYSEGGRRIEVRRARPNPLFAGERRLGPAEVIPSQLDRYQWHVLEHLRRHLVSRAPLNSDGRSATETLRVIERVCALLSQR